MNTIPAFMQIQQRWLAASPREQRLLRGASALVGLALVWWLLLAPPLRTFSLGRAEQSRLDAQWQKMQSLQTQALALRTMPKLTREDALRALDTAVKQQLGNSAQLNVQGDSATITLRATPASSLAQWLPQARLVARAVPSEARLVRGNSNPSGQAVWSGTITLRLPPD